MKIRGGARVRSEYYAGGEMASPHIPRAGPSICYEKKDLLMITEPRREPCLTVTPRAEPEQAAPPGYGLAKCRACNALLWVRTNVRDGIEKLGMQAELSCPECFLV